MDELGGSRLDSLGIAIRKKRSQSLRRRRPEAQTQALGQLYHSSHDLSPLSSIPVSDGFCRLSDDENIGDADSKGKLLNLSQCISRCPSANMSEGSFPTKKILKNGALVGNASLDDGADNGHGGPGQEKKLKNVKVGGVSHSSQAKPNSNGPSTSGATSSGSSAKLARSPNAPRSRQKLTQENPDEDQTPSGKKVGVQGIPKRDFSKGSLSLKKVERSSEKQSDKSDTVRKSKRLPKKRVLDEAFDEDDDDDEIRYLEKLKTSRIVVLKSFEEESTKKQGNVSGLSKGGKYENLDRNRRLRSEKSAEDTGYEEGEKVPSDCDSEGKKKKQKKDVVSTSPTESRREASLTTRQRALLSNKDSYGATEIEFPNGLPPPPSRKQKEKLTEVEQQLKKAEAAQKRRIQNEKAARESEAEAIRKILGQDSSRKKREDKNKKRQDELAQVKAAAAQMLASSTIRLVMGPNGTIVTFPQEMGLPELFESKVMSYPPPREKCVGPLCSNPYKYRDSKSKLPLCSLQCYKAIQSTVLQTEATY